MKLLDINKKLVNVDVRPSKYPIKEKSRSNLQGLVGSELLEIFPTDVILEDFYIPGSKMSLDFFLPNRKVALEIQGKQHNERITHFHGHISSLSYSKQLKRDDLKRDWCNYNNIVLLEIFKEIDLVNLKERIKNG